MLTTLMKQIQNIEPTWTNSGINSFLPIRWIAQDPQSKCSTCESPKAKASVVCQRGMAETPKKHNFVMSVVIYGWSMSMV